MPAIRTFLQCLGKLIVPWKSNSRKLDLGLVSAGSNGFEPKGRFSQIRTQGDNLWSMFHSVCCLFHAKRCPLSHREESSVSLTIYVSLTQAHFRCSSLNGWTEYADVITKFSGIDRFEKKLTAKTAGDDPTSCQVY